MPTFVQVAPFKQGFDWQFREDVWQNDPLNPVRQEQLYEVPDDIQKPPFKHGLDAHRFETRNYLIILSFI